MKDRALVKFGDGGTAEIFLDEQGRIVKLFREWFREEIVDNEYRKSVWAYEQGLPAAKPLGRLEQGGRAGILMERIEGGSLLQRLQREPETAAETAEAFAAYHVQLNGREASSLGDEQRERLFQRIGRTELLDEDERANILAELERLPSGDRLCHGDFHPGNIVVNENGWHVIDWIDACCGHPLYDAARTLLLIGFGAEAGRLSDSMAHAVEVFRSVYLKTYAKLSGFSESEIERWMLPVAAARLIEPIPEAEKEMLLGLIRERLTGNKRRRGLRVVPASPADLERLAPLFDAYWVFYGQPSDPEGAARFLSERLGQLQSVVLLAEEPETGRAAGFAQLYPTFSSVSMQRSWILNDLYVAENFRARGIGGMLLDAAKRHAELTGAKGIALSTAPDNFTAQRLYEGRGYKRDDEYLNYFLTL